MNRGPLPIDFATTADEELEFLAKEDAAVLDRIEQQDLCYFDAMGEYHATKAKSIGAGSHLKDGSE